MFLNYRLTNYVKVKRTSTK